MEYRHVFVAGTFEGLHKGHRALLTRAFTEGRKVTVGITSDEFVNKFKIKNVELRISDYVTRKSVLEDWLRKNTLTRRASIIPIDDPYEPAASMKNLDALVVTKETSVRGGEINRKRIARGLKTLVLIEVPMVSAQDGNSISATRVRTGEIDRDGNLVMPESLRTLLAKPLGSVLSGQAIALSLLRNKGKTIITVGDVATKTLLDKNVRPHLAIIDFRVSRKPYKELEMFVNTLVLHSTRVKSGPGYISGEARRAIQAMLAKRKNHVLLIDGEEDLLVLPVILSASLGSIVYYGQPGQGLVEVYATEKKKQEILVLLDRFT